MTLGPNTRGKVAKGWTFITRSPNKSLFSLKLFNQVLSHKDTKCLAQESNCESWPPLLGTPLITPWHFHFQTFLGYITTQLHLLSFFSLCAIQLLTTQWPAERKQKFSGKSSTQRSLMTIKPSLRGLVKKAFMRQPQGFPKALDRNGRETTPH